MLDCSTKNFKIANEYHHLIEESTYISGAIFESLQMLLSKKKEETYNTRTIHVWHIYLHLVDFMVNVGKYTIHGWYGI